MDGRYAKSYKYKTVLCDRYMRRGHCEYGKKCQFAHGAAELRVRQSYPPMIRLREELLVKPPLPPTPPPDEPVCDVLFSPHIIDSILCMVNE